MTFRTQFISMVLIVCSIAISLNADQRLKAVYVSGGEEHSVIVSDTNEVFAAGYNLWGNLGNGTWSSYDDLQLVFDRMLKGEMNTNSAYLQHATYAAAGWTHSLVLDSNQCVWATGGVITSWNPYYLGQLGDGDEGPNTLPVQVHAGEQNPSHPDYPLRYILKVSAGRSGEHSLAIDSNFCYAWGRNAEAQLGLGQTNYSQFPAKVRGLNNQGYLSDSYRIVALSAGRSGLYTLLHNEIIMK